MLGARRTSWRKPMPGAAKKRPPGTNPGGFEIRIFGYGYGVTVTVILCSAY